jgi:hypothetical protein
MTLFARRTLQRVLSENARFLTPKQSENACGLLNTPHDNYLATEWEQIILNAASKFGTVEHEPLLGKSKPDLLFRSNDRSFEFIADIAAPSDKGFDALNPADGSSMKNSPAAWEKPIGFMADSMFRSIRIARNSTVDQMNESV